MLPVDFPATLLHHAVFVLVVPTVKQEPALVSIALPAATSRTQRVDLARNAPLAHINRTAAPQSVYRVQPALYLLLAPPLALHAMRANMP